LLVPVFPGLGIERRLNYFFAPEAHLAAPTKMMRTSATLVFVGPVITRSFNG
jgi:hypothetical protein